MSDRKFDLIVIGGGPGGYTAAIAASQAGLAAALVERGLLGGTCLNRGCIPTKTLLHDTELLTNVRNSPFLSGRMRVDTAAIDGRRKAVAEGSRAWLQNLLAGNAVTVFNGDASFVGPKRVEVKSDGASEILEADKIVLATGAKPVFTDELHPDSQAVWGTDEALTIPAVLPKTIVVIGGGARGIELALIYRRLGCKIALLEKDRRLLPKMDRALTGRFKKMLGELGLNVLVKAKAVSARTNDDGRAVTEYEDKEGAKSATADRIILCLPRRPDFSGLDLEATGLKPVNGLIETGPGQMTAVAGIYVIGDAAGPPFLAHKAIAQGLAAVRHMTGVSTDGRPRFVPACVYGSPELAGVGLTEDEAKAGGRHYKLGEFHFIGNGRAGSIGRSEGLVRVIADSSSGEVLGVHILGPGATEMISLAALAMENGIDLEGIKKTVFCHPTLAESFFEAALAADGRAIHLMIDGIESNGDN